MTFPFVGSIDANTCEHNFNFYHSERLPVRAERAAMAIANYDVTLVNEMISLRTMTKDQGLQ